METRAQILSWAKKLFQAKSKSPTSLIYWVPPLCWMGVIFYLSSRPITLPIPSIFSYLFHFFEYSLLTLLLMVAFLNTTTRGLSFVFWWSMFWSISYALSDEIHQLFVPGRSCSLGDVAVDALATLITATTIRFFLELRR